MGDFCAEYFDLTAIVLPQERGDFFGKVGSAVHHRQQDTVYLELGVDLPLLPCLPWIEDVPALWRADTLPERE